MMYTDTMWEAESEESVDVLTAVACFIIGILAGACLGALLGMVHKTHSYHQYSTYLLLAGVIAGSGVVLLAVRMFVGDVAVMIFLIGYAVAAVLVFGIFMLPRPV